MKTITIIGGGIAGLSLGIGLRQHGVPVNLVEAGTYPRHRVCGEFINGRGLQCIDELGLSTIIREAGTREARDAAFFTTSGLVARYHLPVEALCISRFILDAALARSFSELGGQLKTSERWRETQAGEGIVMAMGRRPRMKEGGFRWFGIKAHVQNVNLTTDLEMHLHHGAYIGLCRLPGGDVNVCGLFRRGDCDARASDPMSRLRGPDNSTLAARLQDADLDQDSCCTIAGLGFHAEGIAEGECRIGDAFAMTPPVTGNGMSMAFESAACALGPLLSYARGRQEWLRAVEEISGLLAERFARRLFWARLLHVVMFSRLECTCRLLLRFPPIFRVAYSLTR